MRSRQSRLRVALMVGLVMAAAGGGLRAQGGTTPGWSPSDLTKFKSIADVQFAPDGSHIAYTVVGADRAGRSTSQIWVWDVAAGTATRLGGDRDSGSQPRWSPDSKAFAFTGRIDDEAGLAVQRLDGTPALFLTRAIGTNHPLPMTGDSLVWSSGSSRLAYTSGTPGPEGADASGDPAVITRYLYKPGHADASPPLNDNRRLQIFMVDLVSHEPRPITQDSFQNHSLGWSPTGDEILFVSNHEADADRVFNYDIFTVSVARGTVKRLTNTKAAEYTPVWSPDGTAIAFLATKRPLTSSETTMEDTHVWVMKSDGSNRREVGAAIDNRQGPPRWSFDGKWVYFTVQERGDVRLYRVPAAGGAAEPILPAPGQRGSVGAWSLAKAGAVAFSLVTPAAPAELYVLEPGGAPRKLTSLNDAAMAGRRLAPVEGFTVKGEGGLDVEAFMTVPQDGLGTSKHPVIMMLHGGPHAQQGPAFNAKAQFYAARGWATLMVNYRGSTGYGQAFADAIQNDQDGAEARDCLAALDAAAAKYPWLDASRVGVEGVSYGGQLVNWLVTQTDRFKAAIPLSGIANLVSFNYTAYYHDYLAVEFGSYPHQNGVMDRLWERSPLRYVPKVKTPTLILHGELDTDVPISEAEQWYIALKDVGVETVFVRYPREGHGVREPRHQVDALERSMAWYAKWFDPPAPARPAAETAKPPRKK
jgi:dipeptidyl aminopeptidase/acylaminoacyl peptidase